MPTIFSSELQELSAPRVPSKSPSRTGTHSGSNETVHSHKQSLAQAREVRRNVLSRVRNDFTFPPSRSTPDGSRSRAASPLRRHQSSPQRQSLQGVIQGLDAAIEEPDRFQSEANTTTTDEEKDGEDYQSHYKIEDGRVVSWHERNYASSDPSSGEETVEESLRSPTSPLKTQNRRSSSRTLSKRPSSRRLRMKQSFMSGLGFDTGATTDDDELDENEKQQLVQSRKAERKERRRKRLEEEMSWNEGLAFWIAQRDAWCCARKVDRANHHQADTNEKSPNGLGRNASMNPDDVQSRSIKADEASNASGTTLVPSRPETPPSNVQLQHSSPSLQLPPTHTDAFPSSQLTPVSPPTSPKINARNPPTNFSRPTSPAKSFQGQHTPSASPTRSPPKLTLSTNTGLPASSTSTTQIPKTTPILPSTDPTRASLRPALYPSIYSKVIIQSLTPSVPINLGILVPALVDGWKRDGEWPPPSAEQEAAGVPETSKDSYITNFEKWRKENEKATDYGGFGSLSRGMGKKLFGGPNPEADQRRGRGFSLGSYFMGHSDQRSLSPQAQQEVPPVPALPQSVPKSAMSSNSPRLKQDPFPPFSSSTNGHDQGQVVLSHSLHPAEANGAVRGRAGTSETGETGDIGSRLSGEDGKTVDGEQSSNSSGHLGVRQGVKKVGRRLRDSISGGSGNNNSNSGLSSVSGAGDEKEFRDG